MDKLPDELLCEIFNRLKPDRFASNSYGVPKSFRRLALVNKRFNRIATPFLYERISFPHSEKRRRAIKLLKTLIKASALTSFVRDLSAFPDAINDALGPVTLIDLAEIVQRAPALASCPVDYQRQFGTDLLASRPDAMLAAVLHFVPHLESLTIRINFKWGRADRDEFPVYFTAEDFDQTLTMRLIELSVTPSLASFSLFHRLTYVCIDKGHFPDDESTGSLAGLDVHLVSFFLRLPCLKTFLGIGLCDMDKDSTWGCEEESSSVTRLELLHCEIGAASMRKVLRSCRALEKFACTRVCRNCLTEDFGDDYDYSYTDIDHDLLRHRESLHDLEFGTRACYHGNLRIDEPVKTFAALHNLKTLQVDEHALFGCYDEYDEDGRCLAEILPTGLQHITIQGEDREDEGGQCGIYRQIWRILTSNNDLLSATFKQSMVDDALGMLEKLPGIAIQERRFSRNEYGFCTFIMYRAETRSSLVKAFEARVNDRRHGYL